MIPLKDDNPTRRFPVLTVVLILLNAALFALEAVLPAPRQVALLQSFGLIPARLVAHPWSGALLTLFTSQFLHGGLLHLGGNMLYLWIFGNNIEDHLGRVLFLPFYLACGLAAGLAQVASSPGSALPTIGASGAIAGILGAYLVLFPRAQVHTLFLLPFFIRIVRVPAAVWLGIWFVIQLVLGLANLGSEGGVAWFAHLGGFAFGWLAMRAFVLPGGRRLPYPEFDGRGWLA